MRETNIDIFSALKVLIFACIVFDCAAGQVHAQTVVYTFTDQEYAAVVLKEVESASGQKVRAIALAFLHKNNVLHARAVWLLLMAVAAQGLLRHQPVFRRALHRLGLLSLVMVLGHSLCIGTESHSGLMALVVPLLGVMLAGAVLDFLWRQWKLSIQGGVSRAQLT